MRPDRDKPVAIIGGGISGVTTAVLLQVAGYRTVLYARTLPEYGAGAVRPPAFATPHAAASILPHSVASPNVARWTGVSQAFFRALAFRACCGVRSQAHYEIFEEPDTASPDYAGSVENFRRLTPDDLSHPQVPRRSGAAQTTGWMFDAYFCAGPDYLAWLYDFYAAVGGSVRVPPDDGRLAVYFEQGHDVCVNCAGVDAHAFLADAAADPALAERPAEAGFETLADPVPAKLIRGHYLLVDLNRVPSGQHGSFFSYNYKPAPSIYRTAAGTPADVYCYPRSDAWLLGGSRQEGTVDTDGNWQGEMTVGPERTFTRDGAPPLAVPAAILELNAEILLRMTDGALDLHRLVHDDPAMIVPGVGYRFVRDSPVDNVRLGRSRVSFGGAPKDVLHNYGHGGSGFTLSWGCALDILRLLEPPARAAPETRFAVGHSATQRLLADLVDRLRGG
jgi:D-amino-acid oxidase